MSSLFRFFWVSRTWRIVGSICLIGGFLVACRGSVRTPENNKASELARGQQNSTKEAAARPSNSNITNETNNSARDAQSLEETNNQALIRVMLPEQKSFLDQPLPGSEPGRYKKWRETWRLSVNQSHLYVAASLADQKHIIVQSDDEARVRVYDKKSRQLVGNYALGQKQFDAAPIVPWNPTHGSAVGGESSFLIGSHDGIKLVDATSGVVQKTLHPGSYSDLAWSKDAQVLTAEVRSDPQAASELVFFHRSGMNELTHLGSLNFQERVDAWDLSRDNRLLAVSYYPSNNIEVFDLREGTTLNKFVGPAYVGSLNFSPDGRALAVAGRGLLLVDLITPEKRAYYSHFGNNINTVRFSPSGDAIATSSYDGKIRIFTHTLTPTSLTLVQTLTHTGTANVYSLEFDPQGNELMSASGDQTVRRFGAPANVSATSPAQTKFHSVAEWRSLLPKAEQTPPPRIEPSMKDGHYWPPSLNGPARPSRIKPGKYACKITAIYKLRDCFVSLDENGHTLLEFKNDNLLGLKGVLFDDGQITRYEAWLTEPSSIYDCQDCEKQPILGIFRGTGSHLSGLLLLRNLYDDRNAPPHPAADVKIEEADDRFPMTLQFRGP